jgi:hypothetical protein
MPTINLPRSGLLEQRNAADSRWNPAVWFVEGRDPLIAIVIRSSQPAFVCLQVDLG